MKKNYIAPEIQDLQVEEEDFIAASGLNVAGDGGGEGLSGFGGYGGKTNSKDPASRLFDDLGWDDDDEY